MKFVLIAICFLFPFSAYGQQAEEILATAAGKNFTAASLSDDGRKVYADRKAAVADYRAELLEKMVSSILLDNEAKSASSTQEKLLAAAAAKAAPATPAELKAIYDANLEAFGGRSFEAVRAELIDYVKQARERKAIDDYIAGLKAKYKVSAAADVNGTAVKPEDVLVTIGSRSISAAEFEAKNRAAANDFERKIYENLKADLKASILSVLVAEEAKARGVESSAIYASEITDKLRAFTEQEKFDLETALQKRLFAKYGAKLLLTEPVPYKQNISVDDDPSIGPAAAPVTIVMFGDFQCPACAAAHPILRRVIAEFPNKVRLVARDFPLVTIHDNAFRAALAANAANAQGKFFEYADVLYKNQSALDDASLKKYAAGLGLNLKRFELDFTDEKAAAEVRKDMADAETYGVSWTPSIYVNGIKLMNAGADDIREAINKTLAK